MKMSRACPGMLSSENDDFKFLKNCEKHKIHVHQVHHHHHHHRSIPCKYSNHQNIHSSDFLAIIIFNLSIQNRLNVKTQNCKYFKACFCFL